VQNPPLVILDGKELSLDKLRSNVDNAENLIVIEGQEINSDSIKWISILKYDAAKERYGDKGKNGVIVIETQEIVGNVGYTAYIEYSQKVQSHNISANTELKTKPKPNIVITEGFMQENDPTIKINLMGDSLDGKNSYYINAKKVTMSYNPDTKLNSIVVNGSQRIIITSNATDNKNRFYSIVDHDFTQNPPLIILDGKELNSDKLRSGGDANNPIIIEGQEINSDLIKSITVLKDQDAKKLYGDKGKNGVIIIETNDTLNALIIIDEKESSGEEFRKLKREDIHSFSILKDDVAVQLYGDKGKNGVLIIETEKNHKVLETKKILYSMDWLCRTDVEFDPLVIIDGKESSYNELQKLKPENIASIGTKGATAEYGAKGKHVVIYVKTK
jgi:TonB-dependent SusC/RagA subfamily outer membrane receptor